MENLSIMFLTGSSRKKIDFNICTLNITISALDINNIFLRKSQRVSDRKSEIQIN